MSWIEKKISIRVLDMTGCTLMLKRCVTRNKIMVIMHRGGTEKWLVGQSIYAKLWLNPPQIATEAFSSDLLPERSPEKHIKNVEKCRRANIIFFGKIQNCC